MAEKARKRTPPDRMGPDKSGPDIAGVSPARRRAILRERERALASRTETRAEAARGRRVLVCAVGANLYGLPMEQVARIKPFTRWGAAAARHPALVGLVADGGRVAPVFDLARLVGAGGAEAAQGGWLVLLGPPHRAALRLADLPAAAEVEALDGAGEDRARVLSGDHADKILVMLSVEALLAPTHTTSHRSTSSGVHAP